MFQPLKASYQWTARLAASRPGKVERLGHPPPQHHVISRNNYLTADLAAQMCRTLKTKVDRKSAWIEKYICSLIKDLLIRIMLPSSHFKKAARVNAGYHGLAKCCPSLAKLLAIISNQFLDSSLTFELLKPQNSMSGSLSSSLIMIQATNSGASSSQESDFVTVAHHLISETSRRVWTKWTAGSELAYYYLIFRSNFSRFFRVKNLTFYLFWRKLLLCAF